jgi:hypothetical protein
MTDNPFIPTTSGLQPNAGVQGTPGAITASSTTQQTIASSGVLSVQVPAQAAWSPGMFVSMVNQANPANYMWGAVQSYSGTTLNINVLGSGGAGTYSSWYINLSGPGGGATGPAGPTGPQGTPGANGGAVAPFLNGLYINNDSGNPNTQVDIFADYAVLTNTAGSPIPYNNVDVVVDITQGHGVSTPNGMDGESPTTDGFVYFYLISNGTTIAGLASNNASAPTFPAGYTYSVYCGGYPVDSTGNLNQVIQENDIAHFVVTPATNTPSLPVMGNGVAGSVSAPTWVSIQPTALDSNRNPGVPQNAGSIFVCASADVGSTAAVVLVAPNNNYGTATSTNPPPVVATSTGGIHIDEIPIEGNEIWWASSSAGGYLFLFGWRDINTPV